MGKYNSVNQKIDNSDSKHTNKVFKLPYLRRDMKTLHVIVPIDVLLSRSSNDAGNIQL